MLRSIFSFLRYQVEDVIIVLGWFLRWSLVDVPQAAAKVVHAARAVMFTLLVLCVVYVASILL